MIHARSILSSIWYGNLQLQNRGRQKLVLAAIAVVGFLAWLIPQPIISDFRSVVESDSARVFYMAKDLMLDSVSAPLASILVAGVMIRSVFVMLVDPSHSPVLYRVESPSRLLKSLRWIFVTVGVHYTHHSREDRHNIHSGCNFGARLTIWDRLFGTYREPDEENPEAGLFSDTADDCMNPVRYIVGEKGDGFAWGSVGGRVKFYRSDYINYVLDGSVDYVRNGKSGGLVTGEENISGVTVLPWKGLLQPPGAVSSCVRFHRRSWRDSRSGGWRPWRALPAGN